MRELTARCAELIRRAILTMAALPDPDRRFRTFRSSSLPEPVREAVDAYGYETPRAARFRPTPQDIGRCLEVLSWLTWLETEGDGRDVQIIVARAFGAPLWKIARRFRRSDETIRRWEAGAIRAIALRFATRIEQIGD